MKYLTYVIIVKWWRIYFSVFWRVCFVLHAAWLTDYNVNRNFTSVLRIDELMIDESRIYHNLITMVQSVNDALREVYDKYTIAEWIEQKMYPLVVQMEHLQKITQRLKTIKIWPRRPLPPLNDLQRIGVTALSNASSSNL